MTRAVEKLIEADEKKVLETGGLCGERPVINDILVDFYLWNYRVDNADEIAAASLPFHKIRCMFY